jgi:hypothetical protein
VVVASYWWRERQRWGAPRNHQCGVAIIFLKTTINVKVNERRQPLPVSRCAPFDWKEEDGKQPFSHVVANEGYAASKRISLFGK